MQTEHMDQECSVNSYSKQGLPRPPSQKKKKEPQPNVPSYLLCHCVCYMQPTNNLLSEKLYCCHHANE